MSRCFFLILMYSAILNNRCYFYLGGAWMYARHTSKDTPFVGGSKGKMRSFCICAGYLFRAGYMDVIV